MCPNMLHHILLHLTSEPQEIGGLDETVHKLLQPSKMPKEIH